MIFTSILGHIMNYDFELHHQIWIFLSTSNLYFTPIVRQLSASSNFDIANSIKSLTLNYTLILSLDYDIVLLLKEITEVI